MPRQLRVIAADLPDSATRTSQLTARTSYARHVEWIRALAFDHLDLRRLTLVGQDWGGLIGLRLVAEHLIGSPGGGRQTGRPPVSSMPQ